MIRKINNNMENNRDYIHIITNFVTRKSEIQKGEFEICLSTWIWKQSRKFIKEKKKGSYAYLGRFPSLSAQMRISPARLDPPSFPFLSVVVTCKGAPLRQPVMGHTRARVSTLPCGPAMSVSPQTLLRGTLLSALSAPIERSRFLRRDDAASTNSPVSASLARGVLLPSQTLRPSLEAHFPGGIQPFSRRENPAWEWATSNFAGLFGARFPGSVSPTNCQNTRGTLPRAATPGRFPHGRGIRPRRPPAAAATNLWPPTTAATSSFVLLQGPALACRPPPVLHATGSLACSYGISVLHATGLRYSNFATLQRLKWQYLCFIFPEACMRSIKSVLANQTLRHFRHSSSISMLLQMKTSISSQMICCFCSVIYTILNETSGPIGLIAANSISILWFTTVQSTFLIFLNAFSLCNLIYSLTNCKDMLLKIGILQYL
jgi:hypothetical protein